MWRKLPPLRSLIVFETVVRRGGIRRAATDLNVSQPSVTQTIKQLEDHIGVTLFDRTSRPIGLTDAGRLLHDATNVSLNSISLAIEEIGWLQDSANYPCTIAAPVGLVTYWLMPRLAHFNAEFPNCPVNVLTTQEGAPALNSRIDIAIRYGSGPWTDGDVDFLFAETINPVCSPAFAARMNAAKVPFKDVKLIHVEFADARWTSWDEYLQMIGQPKRGTRNGVHYSNYVQATQAALDGQGLMLGWRSITETMEREGRLVPMYGKAVPAKDAFVLVRKHGARHSKSVDLLANWLLKVAQR